MTTRYLLCYDIADPDRLHKVYAIARAWGTYVQDSVYELTLTDKERVKLEGSLKRVMNLADDMAMFVSLGDASRKEVLEVSTLGRSWTPSTRGSVVM